MSLSFACYRKPFAWIMTAAACVLLVAGTLSLVIVFQDRRFRSSCESKYLLLNPLLRCKDGEENVFVPDYEPFQSTLEEHIQKAKMQGTIEQVGIYFRDLSSGPWFGINEREGFFAASLFKLPIMIALYREAQQSPNILDEQFSMTSPPDPALVNLTDPSQTVVQGQYYSVRELLEKMIVYSDNVSMEILHTRLSATGSNENPVESIYRELGVLSTETGGQITPKAYSALLRVLYNGRYLGKEYSEEALRLLSRADFREGLDAGVPDKIVVAHKFGIRDDDRPEKFFHDCGIIYHPTRPYILCIMTRGTSIDDNIALIVDISSTVFKEVDRRTSQQKKWKDTPLY